MLVWRIETATGNGPYRGDGRSRALKDALFYSEDMERHPLPADDGIDIWGAHKGYLFAFNSVLQLGSWFDDEMLGLLKAEGFRAVLYEVPEFDVAHGKRQVAFRRGRAVAVSSQALI